MRTRPTKIMVRCDSSSLCRCVHTISFNPLPSILSSGTIYIENTITRYCGYLTSHYSLYFVDFDIYLSNSRVTNSPSTCLYTTDECDLVAVNNTFTGCAIDGISVYSNEYERVFDIRDNTFSGIGDTALELNSATSYKYHAMMRVQGNTFTASPNARRVMSLSMVIYAQSVPRVYTIEKNVVTGFKCQDVSTCIYLYLYQTGQSAVLADRGLTFTQNEIEYNEGINLIQFTALQGGQHNFTSNGMSCCVFKKFVGL